MGEEQINAQLLSDVEAHTNALVKREQEINRKLVLTELLITRYKIIHDIAVVLLRNNDIEEAKKNFLNQLRGELNFQKIIMLRIGESIEIISSVGYSKEGLDNLISNNKTRNLLDEIFKDKSGEFESAFVSENKDMIEAFDLNYALLSRAVYANEKFYIIGGYDTKEGVLYSYKYPIASTDQTWFTQLSILWSSFVERSNLFIQVNNKAEENKKLAEQREKQVEERTRALLDALFDAKKYKLALDQADIIVSLIDVASHKIIYANELFGRVFGYEIEQIVGRKSIEILNLIALSMSHDLFTDDFHSIMKNNRFIKGSYIATTKYNSEKQVDLSFSRFDEEGGGAIYVIIGRDVTEERSITAKEKEYAENIEKLNRLIINRELRIIELKRKIAQNI